MFLNLEKQLKIGRSFQPNIKYRKILISFVWISSKNILALVCTNTDQSLLMHATDKIFIVKNGPPNDVKIFIYLKEG